MIQPTMGGVYCLYIIVISYQVGIKFYRCAKNVIYWCMHKYIVFKTKILNLKKSRDWSQLQKIRKQEACSIASYSEMT